VENKWKTSPTCEPSNIHRVLAGFRRCKLSRKLWEWTAFPCAPYARSRKVNQERLQASLDTLCPKRGFTITPDLIKRVDFALIEGSKCGKKFRLRMVRA